MKNNNEQFVLPKPLDATFALTDPAYVLDISITRNIHQDSLLKNGYYDISCGLYCHIHHSNKNKVNDMPSVRFSIFTSTIVVHETDLLRINFSASATGIRLDTTEGEINKIDAKERDRLLEFLKNLRGFKINYTADLFGFLKQDGSDKPILIELPFPIIEKAIV